MHRARVNGSWVNGEFEVSTDPARIDLTMVHSFLADSYWAKGIPVGICSHNEENFCAPTALGMTLF